LLPEPLPFSFLVLGGVRPRVLGGEAMPRRRGPYLLAPMPLVSHRTAVSADGEDTSSDWNTRENTWTQSFVLQSAAFSDALDCIYWKQNETCRAKRTRRRRVRVHPHALHRRSLLHARVRGWASPRPRRPTRAESTGRILRACCYRKINMQS
jgi:hypothetical protein